MINNCVILWSIQWTIDPVKFDRWKADHIAISIIAETNLLWVTLFLDLCCWSSEKKLDVSRRRELDGQEIEDNQILFLISKSCKSFIEQAPFRGFLHVICFWCLFQIRMFGRFLHGTTGYSAIWILVSIRVYSEKCVIYFESPRWINIPV